MKPLSYTSGLGTVAGLLSVAVIIGLFMIVVGTVAPGPGAAITSFWGGYIAGAAIASLFLVLVASCVLRGVRQMLEQLRASGSAATATEPRAPGR